MLSEASEYYSPPAAAARRFLPRSTALPVLLLPPVVFCGISWLAGGVPMLTDVGFLLLTVVCLALCLRELIVFPQRFGVGALVLFGGTVVWYCYDYLFSWFGIDYSDLNTKYGAEMIAKVAFLHCLFVMFASIGLLITRGRFMERVLSFVPEPTDNAFYLILMLVLTFVGLLPYLLFSSDAWYVAIVERIRGGYVSGPGFTVSRGATMNTTSVLATIVVQLLDMSQFIGAYCGFYAVAIARGLWTKSLGILLWLFWAAMAIGSGSRTVTLAVVIPPMVVLFIKHNAIAAAMLRRISIKAYVITGLLAFGLLVAIQYQAFFRGVEFEKREASKFSVFEIMGNTMFSEGLKGYTRIPEYGPYMYDSFPGAGVIRPIPQKLWEFLTGFVPRPLWPGKPINEVAIWHARLATGSNAVLEEGQGITGISMGGVGHWYFPYGYPGVLEGALLIGWLFGIAERAMRKNLHRPLTVLVCLSFLVWLNGTFRDVMFQFLYPKIFAAIGLYLLVVLQRSMHPVELSPELAASYS